MVALGAFERLGRDEETVFCTRTKKRCLGRREAQESKKGVDAGSSPA
jgi:hypothetical protein